jgi:hypothetical protein
MARFAAMVANANLSQLGTNLTGVIEDIGEGFSSGVMPSSEGSGALEGSGFEEVS